MKENRCGTNTYRTNCMLPSVCGSKGADANQTIRHVKKLMGEKVGIVDVNQFIEQNASPLIYTSIKAKLLKMSMTNS